MGATATCGRRASGRNPKPYFEAGQRVVCIDASSNWRPAAVTRRRENLRDSRKSS
jgi:hypothetical protein